MYVYTKKEKVMEKPMLKIMRLEYWTINDINNKHEIVVSKIIKQDCANQ